MLFRSWGVAANLLVREYNALDAAGASPEILAAKKAEINAALQKRDAAKQAAKQAQVDLDTAKEQQAAVSDQVDRQKELIDAILMLVNAQNQLAAANKAVEESTAAEPEVPPMPPETTGETLADKINKAAEDIKAAWDKMLVYIGEAITTAFQNAVDRVEASFRGLQANANKTWINIGKDPTLMGLVNNVGSVFWSIGTIAMWVLQRVGYFYNWLFNTIEGWWKRHGESVKTILEIGRAHV